MTGESWVRIMGRRLREGVMGRGTGDQVIEAEGGAALEGDNLPFLLSANLQI